MELFLLLTPLLVLGVVALLGFTGCLSTPPPPAPTVINSVTPSEGPAAGGTTVIVTGVNLEGDEALFFGGAQATIIEAQSSRNLLTAVTPPHPAGYVDVLITQLGMDAYTAPSAFQYGGAIVSFVQVASQTPQTPMNTVTVPFPNLQGAGNLNVVAIGWSDATSSIANVTDTSHNTYVLAVGPTLGNAMQQSIYFAQNIIAGQNQVIVTFNTAVPFPDVRIAEYSGCDPNNAFDNASANTGSSGQADSGPVGIPSPGELLFAAGITKGTFKQADAPFTQRIITQPDGNILEDSIAPIAGSHNATATLVGTADWVMQLVAFRQN
jgi:hypothetical protein